MAPAPRKDSDTPRASSRVIRERMQVQRRRDTSCEMQIRSRLHRLGLRYRVDVSPLPSSRRRADILFSRAKVAVFVDGCFWHGCPQHGTVPKSNTAWWEAKIQRNRERDADTDKRLAAAGWLVVRVWEHEDPIAAADRIVASVRSRTTPAATPRRRP